MALRSVVFLLLFSVLKCITAIPTDSTKIDFEKVNRDLEKPKYPFEPDFRLKTSQIIQAHEVLRIALRSYLDWKDANLTQYLNAMRKSNGSYLDEFGKEIKGYRTIFSLILKQVDEIENNNYAVSQFESDKYDLCSISKYLSHQRSFSDRQNIMTKMGDALGTKCDPSLPYKRKIHGVDPTGSSEKQVIPEKLCPTDSSPAITISDEKYLEKLCNHQSLDVRIRNSYTKEFLYVDNEDFASDKQKRFVLTWKDSVGDIPGMEGNQWAGEEIWRIEPVDPCSNSNNLFRVRSITPSFTSTEYLYANNASGNVVYVRKGLLTDEDSAVLNILGSSAKWQLLGKVDGELRGDICNSNIEMSNVQGWVLRNDKYAAGYLRAEENDVIANDPSHLRRNTRLSQEGPSYWDILPISTYDPVPAPPRNWQDGPNGTKWDMHCDFNGNDIIGGCIKDLSDSGCIDQCIKNLHCTHWAYNSMWNKSCCLKNANSDMTESIQAEAKCGFVPGHLRHNWTMIVSTERQTTSGVPNCFDYGGAQILALLCLAHLVQYPAEKCAPLRADSYCHL